MKKLLVAAIASLSVFVNVSATASVPAGVKIVDEPKHNIKTCAEYSAMSQLVLLARMKGSKQDLYKKLKKVTPFTVSIIDTVYDAPLTHVTHPDAASILKDKVYNACLYE